MDIRASTLFKKSNYEQINSLVNDHFKTIQDRVLVTHSAGGSCIFYDLPENLEAASLEPSQVQLILYSRLIKMLADPPNNLDVKLIKHLNNSSTLKVAWPSALDPREIEKMKEIIKEHLVIEKPHVE